MSLNLLTTLACMIDQHITLYDPCMISTTGLGSTIQVFALGGLQHLQVTQCAYLLLVDVGVFIAP